MQVFSCKQNFSYFTKRIKLNHIKNVTGKSVHCTCERSIVPFIKTKASAPSALIWKDPVDEKS